MLNVAPPATKELALLPPLFIIPFLNIKFPVAVIAVEVNAPYNSMVTPANVFTPVLLLRLSVPSIVVAPVTVIVIAPIVDVPPELIFNVPPTFNTPIAEPSMLLPEFNVRLLDKDNVSVEEKLITPVEVSVTFPDKVFVPVVLLTFNVPEILVVPPTVTV